MKYNPLTVKEIFLHYLNDLPEPVQKAVKFTLDNWNELKIEEAWNFLATVPILPQCPQDTDEITCSKLSDAVKILKCSPEIWLNLENLPKEVWCNVVGYDGDYQVSNYGRVKSFRRGKAKIFRPANDKDGYEIVSLSGYNVNKNSRVHVLVAQVFITNPLKKPFVNHLDAIKNNNCVWNLEWVTNFENCRHAQNLGLLKVGCESPRAKLSPEKIKKVREIYIPGDSDYGATALGKMFGISRRSILNIVHHKTYKDVI